jgi:hypothetical protein
MNKVVARYVDGRVVKGMTLDFSPEKDLFHVDVVMPSATQTPAAIRTMDLKALFFVKDLRGDPEHVERRVFDSPPSANRRRIRAEFRDGEVLVGTTNGYQSGLPGFFLVPADAESNNERCYVVSTATEDVRFI